MAEDADRQSLLDRIVSAFGGDEGQRAFYSGFSIDELRTVAASVEKTAADIRRRGRLATVWADDGTQIDQEAPGRTAA